MKICLFADSDSIHTIRWCNYFVELGHDVHLISFKPTEVLNVSNYFIETGEINVSGGNWKVLLHFRKVKAILKRINPDVFHAHYATSYGITGALCNFHPFVITALGSDVLISPEQSKIVKTLLVWALKRADWITSMADHMSIKINSFIHQPNKITTLPFGIDTTVFYEMNSRNSKDDSFVIVSTRNFEPVYNLTHLILAYKKIVDKIPKSKLVMIGAGSQKEEIQKLVIDLELNEFVEFKGKLTQPEISNVLNSAHLFVSVSKSDGNNISLNEAMACGALCIATNIPANIQWIEDDVNGYLVEIDDVDELAAKMIKSYNNFDVFQKSALPINRQIISEKADWRHNMSAVIGKYEFLIKK